APSLRGTRLWESCSRLPRTVIDAGIRPVADGRPTVLCLGTRNTTALCRPYRGQRAGPYGRPGQGTEVRPARIGAPGVRHLAPRRPLSTIAYQSLKGAQFLIHINML